MFITSMNAKAYKEGGRKGRKKRTDSLSSGPEISVFYCEVGDQAKVLEGVESWLFEFKKKK